ncbi:MAG: pilus assembly protein [Firmicutes bacterium]|nr:pilus assembly protein [Bacillota bacterium]
MMLKNEKGSAIIQVAIMFPILLALTFGMINFILLARDGTIMESAARTGARQVGMLKSYDEALEKAEEDLRLGLVKGASVSIEGKKRADPLTLNITPSLLKLSQNCS